ncbi:TonB-dependent copper receptor [Shewanella sp. D64]|uniref:TonB-dependent copper receptor n=1 Tax=unclassified Shewanella TaxID=196818 RepID=UPI0022BA5F97|nr:MULTISPECIES: TonB-dependent copper receptor [unclassified Shewanella]MEC4727377.1 TonB-dependent copper receptor [Shewanella sp. D64]MEC4739532.1 TonB-dependent copper receptor [Shewanella sp. E94]WBJ96084.1 TonB-dependent copper receptor [Shewanella sp. MTB7]
MNRHNLILASILSSTSCMLLPFTTSAEAQGCDKGRCDEHIVVTGELMREPTKVVTDPKKPRLPLPAYDGAGFLKTIPGFSIGRKGGAGGDPSLRGLGGSRLSIVDDGQHVYGTCGGRMDPPTAYIYPEAYDSITVIKGPQTVKYGPVGSAGTVLFEKDRHSFTEQDLEGRASITGGSFDRRDYLVELKAGDEKYYFDLDINQSSSDHYQDGDGNTVQSSYDRNNYNIALGWTPTDTSVIELAYGESSGEAEYADRANKAREISNENLTLLAQFDFDLELISGLEFQAYANENDHIMDQFDQGINSGSNVSRSTSGGHFWLDLTPSDNWQATVGIDYMLSTHKGRAITPDVDFGLDDLLSKPFKDNMRYENSGLFIEASYLMRAGTLLSGLRFDHWQTELFVAQQGKRTDELFSGFVRYEYLTGNSQYYLGAGHAQRIPDYWEIMKSGSDNSTEKAFELKPEKTTQMDIGWIYQGDVELSSSLFYGKIDDYILIDTNTKSASAYNIDATVWGGEFGISYPFTDNLSAQTTLSYSRGENSSQDTPLGQIPPLEGRISLDYQYQDLTAGLLWRMVAAQDRVTLGQGNISGQDLGESSGFGTLAINGTWKHGDAILVSLGIENLFDITYAEHISRSGAGNDVPGSEPMFQVNEPGRTAWIKLDYTF